MGLRKICQGLDTLLSLWSRLNGALFVVLSEMLSVPFELSVHCMGMADCVMIFIVPMSNIGKNFLLSLISFPSPPHISCFSSFLLLFLLLPPFLSPPPPTSHLFSTYSFSLPSSPSPLSLLPFSPFHLSLHSSVGGNIWHVNHSQVCLHPLVRKGGTIRKTRKIWRRSWKHWEILWCKWGNSASIAVCVYMFLL